MKRRNRPKFYRCPTELTLDVSGGKWKTIILCFLKEAAPVRAEFEQQNTYQTAERSNRARTFPRKQSE